MPADEGRLKARLSGGIDAEIDWSPPTPQCLGGLRPGGDGVRLIYKGEIPGQGPLLVVIGIGPLRPGDSARNVPANLTLVREGAGRFYATQGDDKCAHGRGAPGTARRRRPHVPADRPRLLHATGSRGRRRRGRCWCRVST